MEPALRVALEAVHASPMRAVLHVTGGAAQSLGWVMAVPGASRTLLEARVPYARESMVDTLGTEPKQYVSAQTARDLARTAYTRGVRLSPPSGRGGDDHRHVVGVGCTCALASVPPKKGDHRCVVATYGVLASATYELNMEKGARDRWEEDGLASRLVVQALADAAAEAEMRERERASGGKRADGGDAAIDGRTDGQFATGPANTGFAVPWEGVLSARDAMMTTRSSTRDPEDPIVWVTSGTCDVAAFSTETGELTSLHAIPQRTVILPGSFNPAHDGHREMLAAAAALRPGHALAFELAVTNADKGTLAAEEVRRRAEQFFPISAEGLPTDSPLERPSDPSSTTSLLLTRAPLFSQKAALFPGATFVVGHDTAIRLVMPKYYGGEVEMLRAFEEIRNLGCSFVVAGRAATSAEGKAFLTLADVDVPEQLRDVFEALPGFRNDISSTEIRLSLIHI